MRLSTLIEKLNEKYPNNICEQWDNVGLLIGDKNEDIKKVLVSLDVTSKAIDKAIKVGANLIISHHPLIFKPIKKIVSDDIIGKKILKLIQNNISIYAMHTNLDSSLDGLNDYVFKKLDISAKRIFVNETNNRPLRFYKLDQEISLDKMVKIVKDKLNIQNVRVISNDYTSNKIGTFAIVTGSGMDFFDEVKDKIDLFITGDLKYHDALDSLEYGLSIIDFGHYESEIHAVDLVETYLKENTDLEVERCYLNKVFEFK